MRHFVRDYNDLVRYLMASHPLDEAMSIAVGGSYVEMGERIADFLLSIGLKDGDFFVDVGCGSGRLAHALKTRWAGYYLGTDVVPDMLKYARKGLPETWQLACVEDFTIPLIEPTKRVDWVVFFSVLTHLKPEEGFAYLQEAKRVIKPHGKIVVSFLDYGKNWDVFEAMIAQAKAGDPGVHLNTFLDMNTLITWAERLDLTILCEADLGQRVAVLCAS